MKLPPFYYVEIESCSVAGWPWALRDLSASVSWRWNRRRSDTGERAGIGNEWRWSTWRPLLYNKKGSWRRKRVGKIAHLLSYMQMRCLPMCASASVQDWVCRVSQNTWDLSTRRGLWWSAVRGRQIRNSSSKQQNETRNRQQKERKKTNAFIDYSLISYHFSSVS